jgi:hypothetical protein
VSEELEQSLQQAIEKYVNERLRSIDEQLARLQSDVGSGLAVLRAQSTSQSLDGTSVSAAIFAHLQSARGEHLANQPAPSASSDSASLKQATSDIEAQQSQTDILKALLRGAVSFAERAALFVIKNEQAIGWRIAKASDPDLEMIGGVSLPLSAETVVTRAARERVVSSGSDAADSDYAMLLDQLGGSPATVAALPLVVRGKVVAVLYADSASTDASSLSADALEVLVRVASMAVNLVSIHRAMPAHAPAAPAEAPAPAPEPPAAEATYVPHVEVSAPAAERPTEEYTAPVESHVEAPAPQFIHEPASQFIHEVEPERPAPVEAAEVTYEEPAPAFAAEPVEHVPVHEPEVAYFEPPAPAPAPVPPPPPSAEPAPAFAAPHSAPLGTARRHGVTEPELPIDVSEDERRLHNDARRFARLLVSEIKLYNEPKVQEGRNKGDLYDRLRDDIDRSRQMYDKRVAPPVAARHDYFHQELVNTLAEGDAAKLGMSYPGAAVSQN